ncbi:molybdenum cofactor guanylyltransferase [Marinicella rhabdoformis]|uniref:molybdenum cofactor guanylyltransferase n=1 Tax=Marinicella rhabdoformis TaxID=2580566 RepID=UPI0012AED536|nr:molybdenum cofactor guanylyltransferase [Marinicella rhabdoformis]
MTAGVVLCGGQSSRMGQNKSELIYKGKPLKAFMRSVLLDAGLDSVYFSGPDGIADEQSGLGPLSGMSSSLRALDDGINVLFVPVDMPLLNSKLVAGLLDVVEDSEVTRFEGQHFPLILKNTKKVRQILTKQLEDKQLAIHQLFEQLSQKLVELEGQSVQFTNVNTQKEWQAIKNN